MCEIELIILYTIIDDFVQVFYKTYLWKKLFYLWENKRGFKKYLSLSEVITLNIMRYFMRIEDLKTFHKIIKNIYSGFFPHIPNYENFLKATNKSAIFLFIFLRYLLNQNKIETTKQKYYIDSTDLPVCKNYNIYSHKVAKAFANRGKTTKGWFYGFKLHAICNKEGEMLNIFFTSGNVHDNQVLDDLILDLKGVFVCDSGYLLKEDDLKLFFEKERIMYIATRKNMKRLMSKEQLKCFKERSVIENIWDVLKERFGIIYSLARSIHGLFRHYFYSIIAFVIRNKINISDNLILFPKKSEILLLN